MKKIVLLSVLFWAMVPVAHSLNIFGKDDRVEVRNPQYPLSLIGRLVSEDGRLRGSCTGSLIGRDMVLTNAHCIQAFATKKVYFYPAYGTDYPEGGSEVVDVIHAGEVGRNHHIDFGIGEDWAVGKLLHPIGDRLGFFEISKGVDLSGGPMEVSMAGYSGDRKKGRVMTYQEKCFLHPKPEDKNELGATEKEKEIFSRPSILFHDCDMTQGASGSPIFSVNEEGQAVIHALNFAQRVRRRTPKGGWLTEPTYLPKIANLAVHPGGFLEEVEEERTRAPWDAY